MKATRALIVAVMALFVLATVVSADSYRDCCDKCYDACWNIPGCYMDCLDACGQCKITPDTCAMEQASFSKSCQTRCARSKCAQIKDSDLANRCLDDCSQKHCRV